MMIDKTSGLDTKSDISKPSIFKLGKAFPNPFNNNLTIPFESATGQSLTIDIKTVYKSIKLYLGRFSSLESLNPVWGWANVL